MRWVRGQDRDEVIEIDVNVLVELHRQGALVIAVFERKSRHAFGHVRGSFDQAADHRKG